MEADPYDIRRLLVLRDVARWGSLTEAARRLSFTTSAVSQQISKLEREVGLPLVDRGPRGVHLTDAGEVLVRHANAIDQLMDAARHDMAEFAGLRRGGLRLATFPTVAAALMPQFVTEFRSRHPELTLEIRSARIRRILDMVARHEVELATLWDYPWTRMPEDDVEIVPMMIDPTMVVVPDAHPLARRRSIDLRDLADEPWVTRAEHPVAEVLRRVCREAGFEPAVAFAASDYPELQAMVAAGIGVALAPRLAVLEPRSGVRVVALKGNPAPRRIVVAWARSRQPTPAMRVGVAILRRAGAAIATSGPGRRRNAAAQPSQA